MRRFQPRCRTRSSPSRVNVCLGTLLLLWIHPLDRRMRDDQGVTVLVLVNRRADLGPGQPEVRYLKDPNVDVAPRAHLAANNLPAKPLPILVYHVGIEPRVTDAVDDTRSARDQPRVRDQLRLPSENDRAVFHLPDAAADAQRATSLSCQDRVFVPVPLCACACACGGSQPCAHEKAPAEKKSGSRGMLPSLVVAATLCCCDDDRDGERWMLMSRMCCRKQGTKRGCGQSKGAWRCKGCPHLMMTPLTSLCVWAKSTNDAITSWPGWTIRE